MENHMGSWEQIRLLRISAHARHPDTTMRCTTQPYINDEIQNLYNLGPHQLRFQASCFRYLGWPPSWSRWLHFALSLLQVATWGNEISKLVNVKPQSDGRQRGLWDALHPRISLFLIPELPVWPIRRVWSSPTNILVIPSLPFFFRWILKIFSWMERAFLMLTLTWAPAGPDCYQSVETKASQDRSAWVTHPFSVQSSDGYHTLSHSFFSGFSHRVHKVLKTIWSSGEKNVNISSSHMSFNYI